MLLKDHTLALATDVEGLRYDEVPLGDGAGTVVPGLHFVGVHFLRTRKSSSLLGVAEDAAVVAERIASA